MIDVLLQVLDQREKCSPRLTLGHVTRADFRSCVAIIFEVESSLQI